MNFKDFLTEQKNTHMTHIEDKVLYGGVDGTRQAINALRDLRDMLGGVKEGRVSVKWDGAPAVFAGIDPRDGQFFVAKKGIFNKNPKVYKTDKDIDDDTSGDLNAKLKLALQYLPELGIRGVVQGDFLYSSSDLKSETIKGSKYLTFHPNTIVYAVPAGTPAATAIKASKIGIVWHTTYSGSSFESMKASYGVKVSSFRKSKNVWSQDAMLRDLTKVTMTKKDTGEVNGHLSTAGRLFNQIAGTTLRQLEANQTLAQHIEQHSNSYVRAGSLPPDSNRRVAALIKFIKDKYKKEMAKRKTAAGQATQQKKMDELLSFFSVDNKKSLVNIFELQKAIILAKLKLINSLNKLKSIDTFVKSTKGFHTTGEEGYVAIDRIGSDAVKIVDRMEFSYNNFSPSILKGWDTPTRN